MTAVSVLMPCYNAGETLAEALGSLSSQTLQDFKVVAVDDGSSDSTRHILQEHARKDNRIHVISIPHSGIIPALNCGLEACDTPYVARMDSDDLSHPSRLERQLQYLEDHPHTGVVSCQVAGFPAHQVRGGFKLYLDWLNSLITDEDIRREIFIESPLPHPSVMYVRDLVLAAGGYQEHGWAEDYDLWLRLYLRGARFAKVPEMLLEWREAPERLTRTDSRYSLENFLRLKAFYLARGPLAGRDGVIIWGASMTGRRLSKHLSRQDVPLVAFVDIDPAKIGGTKRGLPIVSPDEIQEQLTKYHNPAILAAVGARRARPLIREHLEGIGLREGSDWWYVA